MGGKKKYIVNRTPLSDGQKKEIYQLKMFGSFLQLSRSIQPENPELSETFKQPNLALVSK